MKIDVAVNARGQALIAYDIPFRTSQKPSLIQYDSFGKTLVFFTSDGVPLPLGRELKAAVCKKMSNAHEALLVCVRNGAIIQKHTVKIVH